MNNENPNQLDRFTIKSPRYRCSCCSIYDREKTARYFMLDGCDDPQCEPVQRFKSSTRIK